MLCMYGSFSICHRQTRWLFGGWDIGADTGAVDYLVEVVVSRDSHGGPLAR